MCRHKVSRRRSKTDHIRLVMWHDIQRVATIWVDAVTFCAEQTRYCPSHDMTATTFLATCADSTAKKRVADLWYRVWPLLVAHNAQMNLKRYRCIDANASQGNDPKTCLKRLMQNVAVLLGSVFARLHDTVCINKLIDGAMQTNPLHNFR